MNPQDEKDVRKIVAEALDEIASQASKSRRFPRKRSPFGQSEPDAQGLVDAIRNQSRKLRKSP